ncbi:CHAD domain-containing protein [Streptomyces sp. WMMB 322]|uniref:CHAD domain-containing protein n=1 Tax=Streptomyces sp. WMMB 322 TaxID=1286821 RepID=UPI0006E395BC|nr:CHAD domain-containing protein [Streptomyces sp. WMMB 322]SCK05526.1 CHAD domain-containing protein [Streptomyces sp. WMMB 322]
MTGQAGGLAVPAALESADPAGVLSESLHAWAAGFMRSLRMHRENAGSAQTAAAAEEAVRRLRRASRRIGSALLTYRPLVDAAWADELSGELRHVSGTLAREHRCAARQRRLLTALHRLAVEGAGGDRAAALLERQHTLARNRAHSAALETLVSSRFHAVADAVAVLAYEVPLAAGAEEGSAAAVLVPMAERARTSLVRAVEALPPSARASARPPEGKEARDGQETPEVPPARGGPGLQSRQDAAWLEVRTLLRHHRYAQEVLHTAGAPPDATVGSASGDPGGGASGAARRGSEGGGEAGPDPLLRQASAALDRYRDSVEAAEAAAAAARTPRIAPATAYALGVLHAGQRQEAEAARREFGVLWQRAMKGEQAGSQREAAQQAV